MGNSTHALTNCQLQELNSAKGELLRLRGFIKNMRFTDIALVVSSRKLDKMSIKGFFIDH